MNIDESYTKDSINRLLNWINSSLVLIFKELTFSIYSDDSLKKSYSFHIFNISSNYVVLNIYTKNVQSLIIEIVSISQKYCEIGKENIIFTKNVPIIDLMSILYPIISIIKEEFKKIEYFRDSKIINDIREYYINLNEQILPIFGGTKIFTSDISIYLPQEFETFQHVLISYTLIGGFEIEIEFKIDDSDNNNIQIIGYINSDYEHSESSFTYRYKSLESIFIDKINNDTTKVKHFFIDCEGIIRNILK